MGTFEKHTKFVVYQTNRNLAKLDYFKKTTNLECTQIEDIRLLIHKRSMNLVRTLRYSIYIHKSHITSEIFSHAYLTKVPLIVRKCIPVSLESRCYKLEEGLHTPEL